MNDSDYFFEQCKWLAEVDVTAKAIRRLLEKLEADWGKEAADRALAIVTREET